jgi:hypothetical protein
MIAAITAARQGCAVTVFERQDRVGRKLLATGNGRCNLTNIHCLAGNYHGENPEFAESALSRFHVQVVLDFFAGLGVITAALDNGQVYPRTGQASAILDVLRFELDRLGVTVELNTPITGIRPGKHGFLIFSDDRSYPADRVIVSGGSRAMPQLGGNAGPIKILEALGHASTRHYPVLVPLKTDCPFNRHLKGTKVDAAATILVDNRAIAAEAGEVLFTDYGLSGPPIIQLSIAANAALDRKLKVVCFIDLFPDWERAVLEEHVIARCAQNDRPLEIALIGLINKRIITALIAGAGINDPKRIAASCSRNELVRLADTLKAWQFTITGALSYNEAHVMAGGISTAHFNPETLESLLVPRLYATGEILDITGDCGGYNLQWAWSSGLAAGSAAANERS